MMDGTLTYEVDMGRAGSILRDPGRRAAALPGADLSLEGLLWRTLESLLSI